jgi:hypothetical protein
MTVATVGGFEHLGRQHHGESVVAESDGIWSETIDAVTVRTMGRSGVE